MFAEVAFNIASGQVYDYIVPPELAEQAKPGCRVVAPFRTEVKDGYIIRLKPQSKFPNAKALLKVEDPSKQIPPQLLKLADWICDYYCSTYECVVWNLLPAVIRKGKMQAQQLLYLELTEKNAENAQEEYAALTPKRAKVLKTLKTLGGALPFKESIGALDASTSVIDALIEAGWLAKVPRTQDRNPFANLKILPDSAKTLTTEQGDALKIINDAIDTPHSKPVLLYGVTGAGKTEVYLQAIAHCLELGREAIVLVPEIALTPQTVTRFRARFGDQVSVLHSGLSDGQRFDEWTRINSGRSRIAVGARSALFAPFRQLGLIVVDEEHESTYKQDEMPHYNARDVAVVRGVLENCAVVLGTATPSMESYYNCTCGKYQLARLAHRIESHPLPPIEIVDMRQENQSLKNERHASFFSRRLTELIHARLADGEQTMLFLNRRGYATQLTCPMCGWTATCDQCERTYTYHRKIGRLICHLCGADVEAPAECPACGCKEIRYGGFGTERIEAVTRAAFPDARVARMDSDTMTNAESYRAVLDQFRAQKIDILIGTQMIAKGLDFPNVTLVGIIQADIGLNVPDFRSAERTFALITQVAGRAGRGNLPGRVVVQTYTPDNYALTCAQHHDYDAFYQQELPGRQALCFPPFSHLVLLTFKSAQEELARELSSQLDAILKPLLPPSTQVIGPMPAPLPKIANTWRYQLLLRSPEIRALVNAYRQARPRIPAQMLRKVRVDIDVDPRFLQ
jgi:primosomal protein N' (replication factor Y) (superfamily II helicase)